MDDIFNDYNLTTLRSALQFLFVGAVLFAVIWPFDKGIAKGIGGFVAAIGAFYLVLFILSVGLSAISGIGA